MPSRCKVCLLFLISSLALSSIVYLDGDFKSVLRKISNVLCFSKEDKNVYNNLRPSSSTSKSVNDQHSTEEYTLEQRKLKTGDFDALNNLLEPTTIKMNDFQTEEDSIKMSASNIICNNLSLIGLDVEYRMQDNKLLYDVNVSEFHFKCEINYSWSAVFFKGEGLLELESVNSSGSTTIVLESQDPSSIMLPNTLTTTNCIANVDLTNLIFSNSPIDFVLTSMTSTMKEVLTGQINILVCEELATMGKGMAESLFSLIDEGLSPHFEPIEQWRLDPLYPENQLQVSDGIQLVNFNDASASPGVMGLFVDIMDLINNHFKSADPNISNMGINKIIRDHVLDDDNAFVLDIANLPSDFNPVLFLAEDKLTEIESSATLEKIRFIGLDSLSRFMPSTDGGNRTFQADLSWEGWTAEIFIKVEMATATGSNSTNNLVENVKLDIELEDLHANISLLMAADVNEAENLILGSLLTFESMGSCVNSIFYDLNMSGFNATVKNIKQPSLSGFESEGIGRVASKVLAGSFDMYKNSFMLALPSYFQRTIRDSITNQLSRQAADATCPNPTMIDGDEFVDFRDLFLQPEDSRSKGGHGDGRYGDIAIFLLDLLRNSTMAGADGLSQLNSNIIVPVAGSGGGDGGEFAFDSEITTIEISDQIQLKASNLRIQNLDTVMAPVDILQPSNSSYIISNGIQFGPVEGRQFNISAHLLFNISEVAGSILLPTESEVDMSVSVDSLEIVSVLFAMLKTENFIQFPLDDLPNVHCWLNAFNASGLYIDSALLRSQNFKISLKCRNCTGPGAQLFRDLDDSSTTSIGNMIDGDALFSMFSAYLESDQFKKFVNDLLIAAPELCPHSEQYNNKAITNYNHIDNILQAMFQNTIIKPFEDLLQSFDEIGATPEETGTNDAPLTRKDPDAFGSSKNNLSIRGELGGSGQGNSERKLKGSK